MKIQLVLAVLSAAMAAVPASAVVVYSNNFDAENGGATQSNYTGFTGLTVTTGSVDLIGASNSFGLSCVTGACVDLNGSSGGKLTSTVSYAFKIGDNVRLSIDLSGNQRGGDDDFFSLGFSFSPAVEMINGGYNFSGFDFVTIPNFTTTGTTTSSGIESSNPYATRSIFFTAGSAGSLTFNISTRAADTDGIGPMLDNVVLDIGPSISGVPEPASWAMILIGFGAIGAAKRRRQAVRTAVSIS